MEQGRWESCLLVLSLAGGKKQTALCKQSALRQEYTEDCWGTEETLSADIRVTAWSGFGFKGM
jgi:hypothetical protein